MTVAVSPRTDDSAAADELLTHDRDGRSDDVLHMAARDGGEVAVFPYLLRASFLHVPDVLQYQLVHDGRRLVARRLHS